MTVLGSLDGIYFISYIHKGSMLETFAIIVNGNLRSIVSHLLSRIQAQVNMNKNKISKSVNSLRKNKQADKTISAKSSACIQQIKKKQIYNTALVYPVLAARINLFFI